MSNQTSLSSATASPPQARENPPPVPAPDVVILFYDGSCGFCSRTIQFILKHERRRHWLRFATLQGPTAAQLREKHPALAQVDSVVWYQPATPKQTQRVLVRSDAGLAVMAYLGGAWHVFATLARWIPRPLRDAVYNLVARHRHRIAPNDACLLPSPEQRDRFID